MSFMNLHRSWPRCLRARLAAEKVEKSFSVNPIVCSHGAPLEFLRPESGGAFLNALLPLRTLTVQGGNPRFCLGEEAQSP